MPTFRIDARTAVIEFEDYEPLNEANIVCKVDVPLRVVLGIQADLKSGDMEHAIETFAEKVLVSWSVADEDGNELPASYEGALSMPIGVMMECMKAWLVAVFSLPLVSKSE
jgi:hypothetical protein